jgi:hypothetical protein
MRREHWSIYNYGRGWIAWNDLTRQRVVLTHYGSFADAVDEFEKKIGCRYMKDTDDAPK